MICTFKKGLNYKSNVTKINESQLRNIIKEAINELDWKTYANAAWKEDMINNDNWKGDNSRAQRFRQAAIDAFNKEHGYKNGEEEYSMLYDRDEAFDGITPAVYDTKYGEPDEYDATKQTPSWEQNPERYTRGHMFDVYSTNGSESANHLKHKYYGKKKKSASNPKDSIPKNYSANLKQAIINGNKEISRYVNGDYDYTPEKGYHLNEGMLRKIIKESINNILKDFDASAYDEWDAELSRLFGEVKVSRFYSGGNRLVIAAKHGTDIKGVIKFAKECGLKFEDYGENGVYAMLTFKQNMNL
jgi:hypothetical protein